MKAFVTGIGWVNGDGIGTGRDISILKMVPSSLPKISSAMVFEKSYSRFRRMDDFSRLGLAAIAYALKDSGHTSNGKKQDIGIIATSKYGSVQTDFDYFNTFMDKDKGKPSPSLFSYTLPNCFLGEAAICFGLTGISFVISQENSWELLGCQMALDIISTGDARKMLCGVLDLENNKLKVASIEKDKPKDKTGAIFLMLEDTMNLSNFKQKPYGMLNMDKDGIIRIEGSEIKDLTQLVNACLDNFHNNNL